MKLRQLLFAGLLVCLCVFSFALAQEKGSKNDKKHIDDKQVFVRSNLAVVDEAGKPVTVEVGDVKIFEDGTEQKLSHFQIKDPITNLGLVVDNTGSMKKNLDEIVKIRATVAEILVPGNDVFVVRFVDSDKVELIQDWTSEKAKVSETIDLMFLEAGVSAVLDAVHLSAQKLAERERSAKSKRYALVLISDAEDWESYYNLAETMALFKDTDIQIFVLSFAENAPVKKKAARSLAAHMALETGGTLYSMPKNYTQTDIIGALQNIAGELRSQYIVGYVSTNQKRDGLPRKLTVQVADGPKGEKRRGIVRENFLVPKD